MKPKRTTTKRKPKTLPMPGMVLYNGKHYDPSKPIPNQKWEGFCHDLMAGMTETDAYRKRYTSCKAGAATINVKACRLKDKVRIRLEWLQSQTVDDAIEAKKTWLRRIRQLAFETDDAKRDALVGKCIEMFGKHYRFLTDKVEVGVEQGVTFGFAIRKDGET